MVAGAATSVLAACLMVAAQNYQVPPAVLIGIMNVEGGRVGQEVGPNRNGSYDLGPMQINTTWLPELSRRWGVDQTTARRWVRDDPCVNVTVAAWILRQRINDTGHLLGGIAGYHSMTPHIGAGYASRVVKTMYKNGLIRNDEPADTAGSVASPQIVRPRQD